MAQAGLLGGAMLVGGILGAVIVPLISDGLRRRKPFIILALFGLLPGLAGITFATAYWLLLASGFWFGFFLLSAGPVGFQYGAELTQPAPEGTSNSLLVVMGQISGDRLHLRHGCPAGTMTVSLVALMALTVAAAVLACLLRESPIRRKGMKPKYRAVPFSINRRAAAASAAVAAKRSTIHSLTEVDITEPRRILREQKLSLTAYVVACLARAVAENPLLNSLRKGRRLILLEDVTVSRADRAGAAGRAGAGAGGHSAGAGQELPADPRGDPRAPAPPARPPGQPVGTELGDPAAQLPSAAPSCAWVPTASAWRTATGWLRSPRSGMFGEGALWFLPLSSATVVVTVAALCSGKGGSTCA